MWRNTMTHLTKVYDYYEKALNAIPEDHPHYDEVRSLLIQQVNDELHDSTFDCSDRRAS